MHAGEGYLVLLLPLIHGLVEDLWGESQPGGPGRHLRGSESSGRCKGEEEDGGDHGGARWRKSAG